MVGLSAALHCYTGLMLVSRSCLKNRSPVNSRRHMNAIERNIERIRAEIGGAATESGRSPEAITLLAVSKGRSAEEVQAAYHAGQRHFGENYLQEALPKIQALSKLDLVWHFIGAIQSNKTRAISEHFQWVHTVDRLHIAKRLSAQRPAGRALDVCLQINLDAEASKAGIDAAAACELAPQVAQLPHLRLRGLMSIPAPRDVFEDQCAAFEGLRSLYEKLAGGLAIPDFDTLSMGMSDDFQAAVREGATIVRIGTAIFGPREAGQGPEGAKGRTNGAPIGKV